MPIPFIMPKFDMDQEKATIISWAKQEGESVKFEETVLTVETDKVAIEVPSPASGTLARIAYQAGEVVPVTTVIAYILKEGETLADLPKADGSTIPLSKPATAPVESTLIQATTAAVHATPVATRMAKEQGVDLTQVAASGDRITRKDIEVYLASQKSAGRVAVAATPAARRVAHETGVALETVPGTGPRGRVQAADVSALARSAAVSSVNGRQADIIELTGIRQTIAERMQSSFQTLPHIALTLECDVIALETARAHLNQLVQKRGEGKLSMTALLVRIVAWALERNRYINASLIDGKIHLWKDVNIGVATAIENGLIVPVLRGANRQSLSQIAAALQDLATRARAGKLGLQDVQHGTFTISNLGMYGITQFRAIINPPESAILAVGAVVRKPVVINDRDEVAVRPMMSITLSADHRVIDGVVAAEFLQDLAQAIEMPEALLY
jgi:pyruvate dehydrogenase E2 component (dihydrolipoamide acetyltransferase)